MARKLFDINGSKDYQLQFTELELSHKTISCSRQDQNQIIDLVNSNLDILKSQGFIKIKLEEFIPANNKIKQILQCAVGSEIDGKKVEACEYGAYRTSASHQLINLKRYQLDDTFEHSLGFLASENVRLNNLKNWKGNGPQLLEHAFNNMPERKSSQITTYYAHAYGSLAFGNEATTDFDISNLGTPIKKIFGSFEGFSKGVITYFGPTYSMFGQHCDDLDANAANLNLGGGTKTWIFANKYWKPRIHQLVSEWERVKWLKPFRSIKQDYLFDPVFYRKYEIPFKVVEQHPGEIIFTGRSVFHEGINLAENNGVVLNVACNVLLHDYLFEYESFYKDIVMDRSRDDKIMLDLTGKKKKVMEFADKIQESESRASSNESLEESNSQEDDMIQVSVGKAGKKNTSIPDAVETRDLEEGIPVESCPVMISGLKEVNAFKDDSILKNSDRPTANRKFSARKKKTFPFVRITKNRRTKSVQRQAPGTSVLSKENSRLRKELEEKNELVKTLQQQLLECKIKRGRKTTANKKTSSGRLQIVKGNPKDFPLDPDSNQCSICGKSFNENRKRVEHHLNHFQENWRRFKCDICGASFNYSTGLITHTKRQHKGQKDIFNCVGCDRKYEWVNKLRQHYRNPKHAACKAKCPKEELLKLKV